MRCILLHFIVLVTISVTNSFPQSMFPSITFQTYMYEKKPQDVVESRMSDLNSHNVRNVDNPQIESRSLTDNMRRRNHVRRRQNIPQNSHNATFNVHRLENGTLKILYGNKPARGKRDSEASDIVFPGPMVSKKDNQRVPSLDSNPCGNGKIFCEGKDLPSKYPQNYLEDVLENSASNFNDILGVDEIDAGPIEIGQRNDFSTSISMCQSSEKIIYPQAAQNKESKWLFIINQPKYEQGVRVEVCESDNAPCEFADRFPNGYTAVCKQKYIWRKMLALDNGLPVPDHFRLPSCCSCSIKIPGEIGTRFSFEKSNFTPIKGKRRK